MKILFLARRFYPDEGGVEKHIVEISKIFIEKGHEVSVITQSEGKQNNYRNIKIVRIPKTPKNYSEKIHIWKWFWKNRAFIKRADIIHAHDVYFWYWPFKFLFLSKKNFVTFHGYETYPIKKNAILSRKISEILANGNIIVGDFIRKWYKTKSDYVIYGGVKLPKKIRNPKNKNSAVFIGRLDEHTGILDYSKAIETVRNDLPEFELKILGDGKYFNKLKKYKPLGFKPNIEEYLMEYNFAFVSRYLSILEALANRRLVFALYDNPVKEDYLKMAPFGKFIVIENNPKKLAEKIRYYLENPKESEKLKNNGFIWVKDQSWENVVNTYFKLWSK